MIGAAKFLMAIVNAVAPPFNPDDWVSLERGLGKPVTNGSSTNCAVAGQTVVAAGSGQYLGVTYDAGKTWGNILVNTTDTTMGLIYIDADNPLIMLSGNRQTVRTDNGGTTWAESISATTKSAATVCIKLLSGNLMLSRRDDNDTDIRISSNLGVTFPIIRANNAQFTSMVQRPDGRVIACGRMFPSNQKVLQYTDDEGVNWFNCVHPTLNTSNSFTARLGINKTTNTVIYADATTALSGDVYKCTDGVNFTLVTSLAGNVRGVTYNAVNNVWWVGTDTQEILFSNDDFATFSVITRPTSEVTAGVLCTTDAGETLHLLQDGYGVRNPTII